MSGGYARGYTKGYANASGGGTRGMPREAYAKPTKTTLQTCAKPPRDLRKPSANGCMKLCEDRHEAYARPLQPSARTNAVHGKDVKTGATHAPSNGGGQECGGIKARTQAQACNGNQANARAALFQLPRSHYHWNPQNHWSPIPMQQP